MMLLLTLTLHFLLSLRSATSAVSAQQPTTSSGSYSSPGAAQDTSSRIPSITPAATAAASSLPPVLSDADATITTTTALRAGIQTWPVHSLFLPIEDPGNLAASIISVHPNHTAYALGCLPPSLRPENASTCPLTHSLTLTEGVSTVIYTQIFSDDDISPLTASAVQVSCALFGAAASATAEGADVEGGGGMPGHASKAACTAHSAISGLGIEAATTTLASTQITYVDVTVTDGQAKLMGTAAPVNEASGGEEGEGSESVEGRGVRVGGDGCSAWLMGLFVVLVGGGMIIL